MEPFLSFTTHGPLFCLPKGEGEMPTYLHRHSTVRSSIVFIMKSTSSPPPRHHPFCSDGDNAGNLIIKYRLLALFLGVGMMELGSSCPPPLAMVEANFIVRYNVGWLRIVWQLRGRREYEIFQPLPPVSSKQQ